MDEETGTTTTGSAIVGGGASSGDNQALLNPVLTSNRNGVFQLDTVPLFGVHMLLSVGFSVSSILLATTAADEHLCEAYFVMVYVHAAFWLITILFDNATKGRHDSLRLHGYLEFYRHTQTLTAAPFYVVSLWNSMLLVVQTIMHHYYGEEFWEHCTDGWLSPISYITAFTIVETFVLTAIHASYIGKVRRFNKSAHPPDAMRGINSTSGSLGLMQPGGTVSDLLEKQSDLIEFLKDHNQKLNLKLHQMQLNAGAFNITH